MSREQRAESLDSIVTDDSEDPLTCPLTQRLFHDPVILVASGEAPCIANFTAHASRRVVGQWGGAGGAICEDHLALAGSVRVAAAACKREKPVLLLLHSREMRPRAV